MQLSFFKTLRSLKSFNISPQDLFEKIDAALESNIQWKEEAKAHLMKFLYYMKEIDASDIDFGGRGVNNKIWYRVNGSKRASDHFPNYDSLEIIAIILSCLNKRHKEDFFKNKNVDFPLSITMSEYESPARFRGDVYLEQDDIAVNFRRINPFVIMLQDLGFPEQIEQRLNLQNEKFGLTLVTGITGAGKSTTLDAIIDYNNRTNYAHIVIIGHPIEFLHNSDKCLIRHRDVGPDVLSFRNGTIEALRQDPDIIVVGEIRDNTTIAALLEITDSGHKTFSTLHTSSAIDSLHRIIAEFPPVEQPRIRKRLAETLSVIISQKLVPTIEGKLTLAKEILSIKPSIRAAIINDNISEVYQMINEGANEGMITMEQDLANLFAAGRITRETAVSFANNKKRVQQILAYI
ncbi:MAG: Flp pilus assembly complex ATPase component TadA [Candidatus Cloacimonetes bacterium]|nr:Flp pilus assembly complex ATPase component TadA [Candidatus Cloacimonadota bacterium]